MKDIFKLEPKTDIPKNSSYVVSYPHILSHFQTIDAFSERDFVCCAHIVYGWMPTVLSLNPGNLPISLQRGAELLTQSKRKGKLTDNEVEQLRNLVNNSLVGASKLLHFSAPNQYAIWDSKIYSFVFEEPPHNYRVNQLVKYREYMSLLEDTKKTQGFEAFHESVISKVGYDISPLRAIELIMFLNSG
jgi:hypothetical protein